MSARDESTRGHAAHTQDAAERGLQGEFTRPVRITLLGAGSRFTPRLVNDVLRTPGAERGEIALCDGWTVESSTRRTDPRTTW